MSCTSRTACIAVGAGANNYCYEDPACASDSRAFAEVWNGVSWSLQSTPGYALDKVVCVSKTACTALGQKMINEGFPCSELLIVHWNGSRWSIQHTEDFGDCSEGTNTTLTSLSCTSSQACIAVGAQDGTYYAEARWNGKRITLDDPFVPPDSSSDPILYAVSCTSATACTAVGQQSVLATVLNWNGRNWTTETAVDPIPGQLTAVSCLSATECTAVGYYSIPPGPNVPIVESTISPR